MRTMALVIGDDPIGQITAMNDRKEWQRTESEATGRDHPRYAGEDGYGQNIGIDWIAIGGRYSGYLIPLPGAEGKRYGDAMPAAEAHIASYLPPGAGFVRPGASGDREGVDQISACDVGWDATAERGRPPSVVVAHGEWHDVRDDLSEEEFVACMIPPDAVLPERQAAMTAARESAGAKFRRWDCDVLTPALDAAEGAGDLVTVVDIHE